MRRIRWAPAAPDDPEQIRTYQQEHYPSRALSTVSTRYEAARSLKRFPHCGRSGEVERTRELVMASLPYIMVYGIEPQMIHIF